MKLIGLVKNVKQENNVNLIGQLVILDSKLTIDFNNEVCYTESGVFYYPDRTKLQQIIPLKHSTLNIEILGVLE